MSKVLTCNGFFRRKDVALVLGTAIVGWGLVQFFFGFLQGHYADRAKVEILSVLRREFNLSNPFDIARTINDMEALGLLKCPVLIQQEPVERIYLDLRFKGGCQSNLFLLNGRSVSAELVAGNGARWTVEFTSTNQAIFYHGLWLARAFVFLGVLGFLLWHSMKIHQEKRLHEIESAHLRDIEALAAQVSHDIRSPLAALLSLMDSDGNDPTTSQLRSAVLRIRNIAEELLGRSRSMRREAGIVSGSADSRDEFRPAIEEFAVEPISELVSSFIAEKRVTLQHLPRLRFVDSVPKEGTAFASIQPLEFSRVVSNLLNNAVEAVGENGKVEVSLSREATRIVISISDTGAGFPQAVLSKLGERGTTFGKATGNGLGLFHARRTLEHWGGGLSVRSNPTVVEIHLPLVDPPEWYVQSLAVKKYVLVISDDPAIHKVFDDRLKPFLDRCSLSHLKGAAEALAWFRANLEKIPDVSFFVSHEIQGDTRTGLDLIDMMGVGSNSVLITFRSHERSIRESCEKLGAKVLSNSRLDYIAIHYQA